MTAIHKLVAAVIYCIIRKTDTFYLSSLLKAAKVNEVQMPGGKKMPSCQVVIYYMGQDQQEP